MSLIFFEVAGKSGDRFSTLIILVMGEALLAEMMFGASLRELSISFKLDEEDVVLR